MEVQASGSKKAFSKQDRSVWSRRRVIIVIILLLYVGIMIGLMMPAQKGPTWQHITVGESTVSDLLEVMGPPTQIEQGLGEKIYYFQSRQFSWVAHKVYTRGDRVIRIEEDMAVYHPQDIHLTSIVERYGNPEYITYSSESPGYNVAVYPDQGILVVAPALPFEEAEVTRVIYFRPCSMFCIQLKFAGVFSPINPFPNSDIISYQDPWGLSQKTDLD